MCLKRQRWQSDKVQKQNGEYEDHTRRYMDCDILEFVSLPSRAKTPTRLSFQSFLLVRITQAERLSSNTVSHQYSGKTVVLNQSRPDRETLAAKHRELC